MKVHKDHEECIEEETDTQSVLAWKFAASVREIVAHGRATVSLGLGALEVALIGLSEDANSVQDTHTLGNNFSAK